MKRIAVFASGSGTNAENFINYFRQSDSADIALILSDNPRARVLERAAKYSVPTVVFSREDLHSGKVLEKLEKNKIDFIVLAGFLRLVPAGTKSASSTSTPPCCQPTGAKACTA